MTVIRRTPVENDRLKIVVMRRFGWMVILTALAFHASAQTVVRGGALPPPLPLFPPDNWWNTDVSAAPVDSNSAAFINFIGPTRGMHPDFGGESGDPSSPIYGMPYATVAETPPSTAPLPMAAAVKGRIALRLSRKKYLCMRSYSRTFSRGGAEA